MSKEVPQIHELAQKYGVNEQLARAIITCESHNNPYATHYNAQNNTTDFSYWQINGYWWGSYLKAKGWDITNPEENLEAGFYLLKTRGTGLWSASYPCWQSY